MKRITSNYIFSDIENNVSKQGYHNSKMIKKGEILLL